jgi:hypothetical protein
VKQYPILFIIDNNEEDRKKNIQTILSIFDKVDEHINHQIISVQNDCIEIRNFAKFRIVLSRSKMILYYTFKWRIMLEMGFFQIISDSWKDVIRLFTNIFRYQKFYNKLQIEMYLTQKHLYCWRNQVQENVNSIIVENDLYLNSNSNQTIKNLQSELDSERVIFFSHSIRLEDLMLNSIMKNRTDYKILFSKIVSNGCSGYLLPVGIASLFIEVLTKKPSMALLPIDFLIVAIGIELERLDKLHLETLFIYPSDFIHLSGSQLKSGVQI